MLDCIEISAGEVPDASIIWLHGLGADGSDFVPVAEQLALPAPVRYVFPHAPVMPVTCNGGYIMPAWYDIYTMDIAGNQDEAGIRASGARLAELIDREVARGIAPERIVLAGFSQGGAIALQTALRYPARLGGVLALSTYLPLAATLAVERSKANRNLPIFFAHGRYDGVIPMSAAKASSDLLASQGDAVEWREYAMEHSVNAQEVEDIRRFLIARLS